jgi:hypothetical protein
MAEAANIPAFSIRDAFEVLKNLEARQLEQLILVGGQAAAFWIARYGIAEPERVTTKDIDVLLSDSTAVVVDCAIDLHGELLPVSGARTPDVARILTTLRGAPVHIDFLRSVRGMTNSEVIESKLQVPDEHMHGKSLYVMHPVLALTSRLVNTFELEGRLTEENLARLEFSVRALHEYILEQLSAGEEIISRDVLPGIEKVFNLALPRSGLKAWRDHRIDVVRAVPNTSELLNNCPKPFMEKRLPQMVRKLESKREAFVKRALRRTVR